MDVLDDVPKHVLGVKIKTGTQIILTFILPAWLELIAYLLQVLSDIAVSIQYFRQDNSLYGALTLGFVILPSVLCFTSIVATPNQWPAGPTCHKTNGKFFLLQFFNVVMFPVGAVYRFSHRLFWSTEALFHETGTYERENSLEKAAKTSPFELYHFMQAYLQAAPQVILQTYAMLNENIFRDYETTHVQIMSIVFSLVNMAVITMSFQRFESQKNVGRNYPWAAVSEVQYRKNKLQRRRTLTQQIRENKRKESQSLRTFPESEHIIRNFKKSFSGGSDSDGEGQVETAKDNDEDFPVFDEESQNHLLKNATDDDKLSNSPDEVDLRRGKHIKISDLNAIEPYEEPMEEPRVESMRFDSMPEVPPPPPPVQPTPQQAKPTKMSGLKRLSTWKDMLILDAEMYIKENVPHPPQFLIERIQKKNDRKSNSRFESKNVNNDDGKLTNPENTERVTVQFSHHRPPTPIRRDKASNKVMPEDETDFLPPVRRSTIKGIEQDEFIGKFVSFLGWIMFILMRMLSLSVFLHFYHMEFIYTITVHYFIMLCFLLNETKFQEKLHRMFFYILLAYIYIFVVIEFKIEFKHIRRWYIGYVLFVLLQNILMTVVWHNHGEFVSWWYEYIFMVILGSGFLSLKCMLFYYFMLRPKDVLLFES